MNKKKSRMNQTDLVSDKPEKKPWSAPKLTPLTRRNIDGKPFLNTAESGGGGGYPNYGPS